MKAYFPLKIIVTIIVTFLNTPAGEDEIAKLLTDLNQIPAQYRQDLLDKYAAADRAFREHYMLIADIRLFNLKIGRMKLGEVVISTQDSFMIAYDPPFEKWDTRYLTYWIDDHVFVDKVSGSRPEKFSYQKSENGWQLIDYQSENPRSYKTYLFQEGVWSEGLNLIEFTRHLTAGTLAPTNQIIFLGEEYQIHSENLAKYTNHYRIYNFQWDVHEGEENVRLYGVHLVGMESASRFIPLGGILKVSFVGLLNVDLIGIINPDQAPVLD
jgi:hypothetical protein